MRPVPRVLLTLFAVALLAGISAALARSTGPARADEPTPLPTERNVNANVTEVQTTSYAPPPPSRPPDLERDYEGHVDAESRSFEVRFPVEGREWVRSVIVTATVPQGIGLSHWTLRMYDGEGRGVAFTAGDQSLSVAASRAASGGVWMAMLSYDAAIPEAADVSLHVAVLHDAVPLARASHERYTMRLDGGGAQLTYPLGSPRSPPAQARVTWEIRPIPERIVVTTLDAWDDVLATREADVASASAIDVPVDGDATRLRIATPTGFEMVVVTTEIDTPRGG